MVNHGVQSLCYQAYASQVRAPIHILYYLFAKTHIVVAAVIYRWNVHKSGWHPQTNGDWPLRRMTTLQGSFSGQCWPSSARFKVMLLLGSLNGVVLIALASLISLRLLLVRCFQTKTHWVSYAPSACIQCSNRFAKRNAKS